jgi:hypothetical protein
MDPNVTHSISPLMVNLLAHFKPSELADFMNFVGLLIHKLQVGTQLVSSPFTHKEQPQTKMFDMFDKLIRNADLKALLIAF